MRRPTEEKEARRSDQEDNSNEAEMPQVPETELLLLLFGLAAVGR